ncbi:N-acetyl-L,L-diaminopimelate deacetylase [Catenovulum agarivorans DS-2]|uniref:N-acetyl-L,L-diaminopimelate deacetylase n=1 Tax=Catenovulum agarivorans DS-2 TaxID=1328313 RepID=W7QJP2_9ALTE|nr:N(2)-acetyl-L-2,4-diaminobutanoate deacetylase DoeB2 [Catenovulum agarivorans]EWH12091.1 N-acetyl-L,L-diaminopimelate deacetylase [Catenovulum agarivorans DS-2]
MTNCTTKLFENAVESRKFLHAHPELSWQEFNTADYIRQQLDELDIPWEACAETGTIGRLGQNAFNQTPHIALRADIDALPIHEDNQCDWKSTKSGTMHACGHDGHTATLLAAAKWLKQNEAQLPQPVSLIFQPAEEGGHGAKKMIEAGALKGIDVIYGWHNWPTMSFGQMACPDSVVMCGNGTFNITVKGLGGHASQPENCRDPILAASAITLAIQQIVSRLNTPQNPLVLAVTGIQSDTNAATVTPNSVSLQGSFRIANERSRAHLVEQIKSISQLTAQAYQTSAEVVVSPRYQATVNHAKPAQTVREAWASEFGKDKLNPEMNLPAMASEDFSYYLQHIPGAFALIGGNENNGPAAPLHNPNYDFNDKLIPLVCRLFARLTGVAIP